MALPESVAHGINVDVCTSLLAPLSRGFGILLLLVELHTLQDRLQNAGLILKWPEQDNNGPWLRELAKNKNPM
jgi:hypothetical protein